MTMSVKNHSNIRRRFAAATFGLLLSGSIITGLAAPASAGDVEAAAYPSGCSYSLTNYYGARAYCQHNNGGSYRALVYCRHGDGTHRVYTGFWTQLYWSQAYCQGDSKAVSPGIEYSSRNNS